MPQPFLFQAQDSNGQLVADRVEATTLTEAKSALELRGFREIVFVTDENEEIYRRAALADTGVTEEDLAAVSARDHVDGYRRNGIGAHLWWAAKHHIGPVGVLAVWNASSWLGARPFGWGDWLGFAATPLYVLYFLKLSVPFMLFQLILKASVQRDHADLRRLISLARTLRRFSVTGIPESELDFREAASLASTGKLAEALALVERWRDHVSMPKALFLTRVSGLYEHVGDFTTMVALVDEAAAAATTGVSHWIDCAAARIRRLGDVEGAKAALAKVGGAELAALPCAFKNMVEGIIAVEEGDDAKAVELLDGAIDDLAQFANPLMDEIVTEAKAYLLIAEARLGKLDVAQAHFAEVRALLKIHRPNDLYPRCAASVAA